MVDEKFPLPRPSIRAAPGNKRRRQQRVNQFAALVGAGDTALHDAPFRSLLAGAQRYQFRHIRDGVARQHRLDPAQVAKPRGRSPHRDLLATRRGLPGLPLAVSHQQLHAGRTDMPAGCGEAAEQRVAALFLVEMKTLRIELNSELLDQLRGEGERSQFAALPDRQILEKPHQLGSVAALTSVAAPARRSTIIGVTISHSASPAALRILAWKVTIPVAGRLFERRASATSTSSVRSSP